MTIRYMDELDYGTAGALRDVEAVIRRDGHARLEGAFVEHLVMQRLVDPIAKERSGNFWFASTHDWRYRAFYLVRRGEPLPPTANRFANMLHRSPRFDVYVIEYEAQDDTLTFTVRSRDGFNGVEASEAIRQMADLDLQAARQNVEATLRQERPPFADAPAEHPEYEAMVQAASRFLHHERRPARAPNLTVRPREDVALAQLRDLELLDDLLIDRVFVNYVLNRYFLYIFDLDAVALIDDRLVGFEIKRKYPSAEGYFGINVSLHLLFRELTRLIPIAHLVVSSSNFADVGNQASPITVMNRQPNNVLVLYKLITSEVLRGLTKKAFVPLAKMTIGPEDRQTYMHGGFRLVGCLDDPNLAQTLRSVLTHPDRHAILSEAQVLALYPLKK